MFEAVQEQKRSSSNRMLMAVFFVVAAAAVGGVLYTMSKSGGKSTAPVAVAGQGSIAEPV